MRARGRWGGWTQTGRALATASAGGGRWGEGGEGWVETPADDLLGDVLRGGAGGGAVGDEVAIAHDRDLVAMGRQLLEPVGDGDDRSARFAERAQDAEEDFGLVRVEHGGRLVEDEHGAGEEDGLDGFDLLLAGGAEASGRQCEALLENAVSAAERYYPAFQFVIWAGKTAREAMDATLFETAGEA